MENIEIQDGKFAHLAQLGLKLLINVFNPRARVKTRVFCFTKTLIGHEKLYIVPSMQALRYADFSHHQQFHPPILP